MVRKKWVMVKKSWVIITKSWIMVRNGWVMLRKVLRHGKEGAGSLSRKCWVMVKQMLSPSEEVLGCGNESVESWSGRDGSCWVMVRKCWVMIRKCQVCLFVLPCKKCKWVYAQGQSEKRACLVTCKKGFVHFHLVGCRLRVFVDSCKLHNRLYCTCLSHN